MNFNQRAHLDSAGFNAYSALNKSIEKRLIDRKTAVSTNRHSIASGQYLMTSPLTGAIKMSDSVLASR